jgi:protein arginine phosphatase
VKHVLFVCTGNTCRSPMAEALANERFGDKMIAKSAGVFASPGMPASINSIEALKEKDVTLAHQSSPLTEELISWADIILTMTENHKRAIVTTFPKAEANIYTLKEYAKHEDDNEKLDKLNDVPVSPWDNDISDPFGGSLALYKETLTEIEEALERIHKKLGGK